MRRRVERFEQLDEPVVAMNNTIRAFARMPIKVHLAGSVLDDSTQPMEHENHLLDVVIAKREDAATDIASLELTAVIGGLLPAFEAGAHIDVFAKSGVIRQYSLTGDPSDRSKYRLGILLEPKSRGGSSQIHTAFKETRRIRIGHPRNNFSIQQATHCILFAGGIGVTSMLSMAHALEARGASWELHYCARSIDRLVFLQEMAGFGNESAHLYSSDVVEVIHGTILCWCFRVCFRVVPGAYISSFEGEPPYMASPQVSGLL